MSFDPPTEEQMDADFQRWCAMEEEVPEGLRYHPLIIHRADWTRGRDLSQYTEAQLRAMTGTEVERE